MKYTPLPLGKALLHIYTRRDLRENGHVLSRGCEQLLFTLGLIDGDTDLRRADVFGWELVSFEPRMLKTENAEEELEQRLINSTVKQHVTVTSLNSIVNKAVRVG